jgi:hypothetical protein
MPLQSLLSKLRNCECLGPNLQPTFSSCASSICSASAALTTRSAHVSFNLQRDNKRTWQRPTEFGFHHKQANKQPHKLAQLTGVDAGFPTNQQHCRDVRGFYHPQVKLTECAGRLPPTNTKPRPSKAEVETRHPLQFPLPVANGRVDFHRLLLADVLFYSARC